VPAKNNLLTNNVMTTKSKLTVLSLVAAILVTSFATALASADSGQPEMDYETRAERHLERTGEVLSEDTFNVMEEARELRQSGDREGARALIEDAGIDFPRMGQMGEMRGQKGRRGYFMQNLTDEQKEIVEAARELRQEGDHEGAKQLIEDSGIELPKKAPGKGKREGRCER
jgi:hypothetical protein